MKTSICCLLLIITQLSVAQKSRESENKKFGITISLPYINSFHFHHYEKNKDTTSYGFVGTGLSVFYKTNKDKISLGYSLSTDALYPVGPIDYFGGSRTQLICSFFEVLYHRKILKRLRVVTGVNISKYEYNYFDYDLGYKNYKADKTAGLSIGPEYFNERNCSIALLYKPVISSFDAKGYMHQLTIDFRFDINIIKQK